MLISTPLNDVNFLVFISDRFLLGRKHLLPQNFKIVCPWSSKISMRLSNPRTPSNKKTERLELQWLSERHGDNHIDYHNDHNNSNYNNKLDLIVIFSSCLYKKFKIRRKQTAFIYKVIRI